MGQTQETSCDQYRTFSHTQVAYLGCPKILQTTTYSSMGPSYFGLLTNMTLRRSARHLMMCMKRSNGVEAGLVVYIT